MASSSSHSPDDKTGCSSTEPGSGTDIATVLYGINNIFTVRTNGHEYLCRLKGKRLRGERRYNALAPGDRVICELNKAAGSGMIQSACPRDNAYVRWNPKRNAPQSIAANLDLVLVISSVDEPAFRPRFVDAALVAAEHAQIPAGVVLNKFDLRPSQDLLLRMQVYAALGYEVFGCAATSGEGVDEILEICRNKTVVLVGQSGVGKSTLLNRLVPGADAVIGEISQKYNRGKHTTRFAAAFDHPDGGVIIDSPGIREFSLPLFDSSELGYAFPEIRELSSTCHFAGCTHSHEPSCAVRDAAERGEIHPDRYESYLRLLERSCI